MRVCDSCYEEYGPKEGEGVPGAATSPLKTKKEPLDGDLPAEYLASPLSQQVCSEWKIYLEWKIYIKELFYTRVQPRGFKVENYNAYLQTLALDVAVFSYRCL